MEIHFELTISVVVRALLFFFALFVFIRLHILRKRKWKTEYTAKEKSSWKAFLIVDLTFMTGYIENVVQGNPLGIRTVLGAIALASITIVTYTAADRQYVINPSKTKSEE